MRAITTYDHVSPVYDQDTINGFTPVILDRLVEAVDPASASTVLDAMAGNGNGTAALLAWCGRRHLRAPALTCLDISARQCTQARRTLAGQAQVVWGDLLSLHNLDLDLPLVPGSYDRILIKSGGHEIPRAQQRTLYQNLHALLKAGGWLVLLDALFESEAERDEFQAIIRFKDRLAGLDQAARNRYVPTRQAFYGTLWQAGFAHLTCAMAMHYTFRSWVMVDAYFPEEERWGVHQAFQAQQERAYALQRAGRISMDPEGRGTLLRIPGEITVAYKP